MCITCSKVVWKGFLWGGFTIVLKATLVMKVKVVLSIDLALAANLV